MAEQESSFLQSIYENMQLKNSEELLKIWIQNDRVKWTDEAFAVIHDILLERLGSVPEQKAHGSRRRHKKESKGKAKIPTFAIIFSPLLLLFLLVLLIPVINPGSDDKWFTVLLSISMALCFFVPGFYLGWKSIFRADQYEKEVAKNLPNMKKNWGFFYPFITYFLPDRFVPVFFLTAMRFTSVVLILGGVGTVRFLIEFIG